MTRIAPIIALLSSLLMACGTTGRHSFTTVDTRQVDLGTIPSSDTPIEQASRTGGAARTTRVALRSGTVLVVPGDARLYRDGDSVLIQPEPTSLMLREVPVDDITRIEVQDIRLHETKRSSGVSSKGTAGIILGVVGVVVLGALAAHEMNSSLGRTSGAILGGGGRAFGAGLGGLN